MSLLEIASNLTLSDSLNQTNLTEVDILTSTVKLTRLPPPEYLHQTVFVCKEVLLPIVVALGMLGNCLSLMVLTRREMAAPTTCFLTALASSDLVLLTLQLPTFFTHNRNIAANDSFQIFHRYYTVIRYVMNNVFITCTCWLTVAVALERFISLRFMLHPKIVCTIHRARVSIILIFILSFIFHFSKFFEYVPNLNLKSKRPIHTTHLTEKPVYETYIHIANIALAAIIPFFLLIVANAFLIYFLVTHRRRMSRHKSAGSNMNSLDMIHVSAIVIATILVFIACHSVGVTLALTIASRGRNWVFSQPIYRALKEVNTLLVMLNSSVNFLLYCAISRKFRKIFTTVFCRRVGRMEPWTSAMPLSENSTNSKPVNGKIYSNPSKSQNSNSSSVHSNSRTSA